MSMATRAKSYIMPILTIALLLGLILCPGIWEKSMQLLFPGVSVYSYPGTSMLQLVEEHLLLVAGSSALAILIGVGLGVLITRPFGREFLGPANDITAMGQTFPPVAVIALAVPLLGFGYPPTLLALLLYGIMPVLKNTMAGLDAVSPDVIEAAYGLGMSRFQLLRKIEMPLAFTVIMAGIRTSVIVNIGTATIGAAFGAGGLGSPIMAGLVRGNMALILEGAIPVALLAIIADMLLAKVEISD